MDILGWCTAIPCNTPSCESACMAMYLHAQRQFSGLQERGYLHCWYLCYVAACESNRAGFLLHVNFAWCWDQTHYAKEMLNLLEWLCKVARLMQLNECQQDAEMMCLSFICRSKFFYVWTSYRPNLHKQIDADTGNQIALEKVESTISHEHVWYNIL